MEEETDKKRILIITGGNVERDFAALWVKENAFDLCIAVDRGAEAALDIGLAPAVLIGDFDSIEGSCLEKIKASECEIIKLNPEKDATDTELAILKAREYGAEEIYMLGATGERADHTFTTLMSIARAKENGLNVFAVDRYNKIYAANGDIYIKKDGQHGDYVSIAVISASARISIKGMKYGLRNTVVYRGSSLCQSNEVTDEMAHICIDDGMALIFESRDGD